MLERPCHEAQCDPNEAALARSAVMPTTPSTAGWQRIRLAQTASAHAGHERRSIKALSKKKFAT
jgi:hypothetical protein